MAPDRPRASIIQDLALIAAANIGVYYIIRYALNRLEPEDEKKRKATAAAVMQRLDRIDRERGVDDADGPRRPRKEELQLNQYEQIIASEVIAPDEIPVSFNDIGGLNEIIEELRESVIYPLTMPHLYAHTSSLLSAPSGVLLYGPPGCGKTMLAKALARESGATFINLHISTVTEKWFGDSNKLVHAVFTLARKLQPSIVFIDEIDAVLGQRRSGEHEASGMVKAEFMTHWDGLTSANRAGESQRILILGATNRIQDIDEAILRRMPKKFPVTLPTAQQRVRIFALLLKDTKVDRDNFDLEYLVKVTAGMSGSDLKEACRDAAMVPVREYIRRRQAAGAPMGAVKAEEIRGLRTADFFTSAGGHRLVQTAGLRQQQQQQQPIQPQAQPAAAAEAKKNGSAVKPKAKSAPKSPESSDSDEYSTTEEESESSRKQ